MANYSPKQVQVANAGDTYTIVDVKDLVNYGGCSTAAGTQTKAVTISGITALEAGLSVRVRFANGQSYDGQPKLNLNELGAKNIYRYDLNAAVKDEWDAGAIIDLTYDGYNWVMVGGSFGKSSAGGVPTAAIVDLIYPVGSIYMSVASTSPATLFGGTWDRLKDRFLLGASEPDIPAELIAECETVLTNNGTTAEELAEMSDYEKWDAAHTLDSVAIRDLTDSERGHPAGNTGGATSQSYTPAGTNSGGSVGDHTLTTDEIPSHDHTFTGSAVTSGGISANHTHTTTTGNPSANHYHSGPSHTHTGPSHSHSGPNHSHSVSAWGTRTTAGGGDTSGTGIPPWGGGASGNLNMGTSCGNGGTGSTGSAGTGNTGSGGTGNTGTVSAWHTHTGTSGNQSAGHTHSVTASGSIGSTGGGGAHNHGFTDPTFTGTEAAIDTMPPYLAVYMWKRTA